jgi:hypothetical protein
MVAKFSVGVFILTLSPAIVAAQNAVLLSTDDIYVTTQSTKKTSTAPTRLCGFQIRGNHRSRANPRVEWDINVDEIESGADRLGGVTAGAFDVLGHQLKARPPIVDLGFSIEGNPRRFPRESWAHRMATTASRPSWS